ncbi:hypothetical protein AB5I41_28105 [Sphingomonas sp. MMS24-JH45]
MPGEHRRLGGVEEIAAIGAADPGAGSGDDGGFARGGTFRWMIDTLPRDASPPAAGDRRLRANPARGERKVAPGRYRALLRANVGRFPYTLQQSPAEPSTTEDGAMRDLVERSLEAGGRLGPVVTGRGSRRGGARRHRQPAQIGAGVAGGARAAERAAGRRRPGSGCAPITNAPASARR